MKAPRKTIKRPIFRSNEIYDVEIKEEGEKKEILFNKPDNKNDTLDTLDPPIIQFDVQEPFFSIELSNNLIDEVSIDFFESFNETIDFTDSRFEFSFPIEFYEVT